MTLLRPINDFTIRSSTQLLWNLLTFCIRHKLPWFLLNILRGANRLGISVTFLFHIIRNRSASILILVANDIHLSIALLYCFIVSHLFKDDLTYFLEVLVANFLLEWFEFRDVGEMTLAHFAMVAL